MIDNYKGVCALGALCAALIGCGDPLEGDWESEDEICGDERHEFTIETGGDEIKGDGKFFLGACQECDGEISGSADEDGEYDVDVDFSGDSDCDDVPDADCKCKLSSDESSLSCECDSPYGDLDFDRVEPE